MKLFLSRCRNSMGSSMVIKCSARLALMRSIIAASVVDLPEPVVPVTSTNPRCSSQILEMTAGRFNSSVVRIFVGMTRFFFFNDTATTEIYTLSLHYALPISPSRGEAIDRLEHLRSVVPVFAQELVRDRKSTRLNSSHVEISYAVFCLKK